MDDISLAIREAGGDVAVLRPLVVARVENGEELDAILTDLRRFPAHDLAFTSPQARTRGGLKTARAKSDYISRHGLRAFLDLPAD